MKGRYRAHRNAHQLTIKEDRFSFALPLCYMYVYTAIQCCAIQHGHRPIVINKDPLHGGSQISVLKDLFMLKHANIQYRAFIGINGRLCILLREGHSLRSVARTTMIVHIAYYSIDVL